MTAYQKTQLQEILARLNKRRAKRNRPPIGESLLPLLEGRDLSSLYLVDRYTVRRHWRRRPSRA